MEQELQQELQEPETEPLSILETMKAISDEQDKLNNSPEHAIEGDLKSELEEKAGKLTRSELVNRMRALLADLAVERHAGKDNNYLGEMLTVDGYLDALIDISTLLLSAPEGIKFGRHLDIARQATLLLEPMVPVKDQPDGYHIICMLAMESGEENVAEATKWLAEDFAHLVTIGFKACPGLQSKPKAAAPAQGIVALQGTYMMYGDLNDPEKLKLAEAAQLKIIEFLQNRGYHVDAKKKTFKTSRPNKDYLRDNIYVPG
jgi:hypothetical protein